MALNEQTTYRPQNMFAPLVKSAYQIGQTLPKKVASPSATPVSNYQGLRSQVSGTSKGTVTVPYGGSTKYEKFHPGIDIAAPMGTPFGARTGGIVSEVVTGKKQGDPGYGNYVIVTDEQGNKHRYSHLARSFVQAGQQIQKGIPIGAIGNTGQTYSVSGGDASHLDYRIKSIYDAYLNPAKFLM